ncbi:hypothetical protein D9M73_235640 [compost metagenome]
MRRLFVQTDAVVAVVERLHPVVVDLHIPEIAVGHLIDLDQQCLVISQSPVRVVIENVRVAPHRLAQCLVGGGQLIGVLLITLSPVGE